jgi:hypothetical protein
MSGNYTQRSEIFLVNLRKNSIGNKIFFLINEKMCTSLVHNLPIKRYDAVKLQKSKKNKL